MEMKEKGEMKEGEREGMNEGGGRKRMNEGE